MLGYMDGSFFTLVDALVKGIKKNGGQIRLGYTAFDITKSKNTNQNKRFTINCMLEDCSSIKLETDFIAVTTSTIRFNAMSSGLGLTPEYIQKTSNIKYKGNLCMILRLKNSLSPYYWTTICDNLPFVVVVEHTNITGLRNYGGHIIYLSRYLDIADPLWNQHDSEVFKLFCKGLKEIYPNFSLSDVRDWRLTRSRYSQPVIGKNYSEKLPEMNTPVKGLYLAGMAQIYPEDRGMNYAIRLANEVALEITDCMKNEV